MVGLMQQQKIKNLSFKRKNMGEWKLQLNKISFEY
jgi:hypothetical protein